MPGGRKTHAALASGSRWVHLPENQTNENKNRTRQQSTGTQTAEPESASRRTMGGRWLPRTNVGSGVQCYSAPSSVAFCVPSHPPGSSPSITDGCEMTKFSSSIVHLCTWWQRLVATETERPLEGPELSSRTLDTDFRYLTGRAQ